MVYLSRDTVQPMGRPTLGTARNDVLRHLVRDLVSADFADTKADAARALGVSAATIGDFLSGKKGAGSTLQDALVRYLGRSMDQINAARGDLAALRGMPSAAPVVAGVVRVLFGELPNWSSLQSAARSLRREHPAWVWERLAYSPVWLEGPATAMVVAECADIVARHVSPPT